MKQTGREKFARIKNTIFFFILLNSILPYKINLRLLITFRYTTGKLGLLIRYIIVKNIAKSCGDNVSIHPGVYLFNLKNLVIGNNVSIHPMCYIDACGPITIGNNVSIAHGSSILTVNHTFNDISIPIKYNQEIVKSVSIEDDVWIGCGCKILAGVQIKNRCVIAAGAVVISNVESNTIVGGIPAKPIKQI